MNCEKCEKCGGVLPQGYTGVCEACLIRINQAPKGYIPIHKLKPGQRFHIPYVADKGEISERWANSVCGNKACKSETYYYVLIPGEVSENGFACELCHDVTELNSTFIRFVQPLDEHRYTKRVFAPDGSAPPQQDILFGDVVENAYYAVREQAPRQFRVYNTFYSPVDCQGLYRQGDHIYAFADGRGARIVL
jgi:hypothetical protein